MNLRQGKGEGDVVGTRGSLLLGAIRRIPDGWKLTFRGAGVISGIAILVMALLTAIEVIARDVFNKPFVDTVLIGELSIVVLTYLGIAWVFRLGRHVSVRIFVQRLPVRLQLWIDVIALSVTLGGLGIAVYETWSFAHTALRLNERLIGTFRVDAFPFQVMMPIGLTFLAIEVLRRIALDLWALKRGEALPAHLKEETPQE